MHPVPVIDSDNRELSFTYEKFHFTLCRRPRHVRLLSFLTKKKKKGKECVLILSIFNVDYNKTRSAEVVHRTYSVLISKNIFSAYKFPHGMCSDPNQKSKQTRLAHSGLDYTISFLLKKKNILCTDSHRFLYKSNKIRSIKSYSILNVLHVNVVTSTLK